MFNGYDGSTLFLNANGRANVNSVDGGPHSAAALIDVCWAQNSLGLDEIQAAHLINSLIAKNAIWEVQS